MKPVKRITLGKNKYIAESFYNVCYWWFEVYDHPDVFSKDHPVSKIAREMKGMLINGKES